MAGFTYKFTGLESVVNNLEKKVLGVTEPILIKHLNNFGVIVEAEAKRLVPVDEGILRNSIGHKLEINGKFYVMTITVNTPYAAYIEFGTKKFAAAYVGSLPPDWQSFAAKFKGKGGSGTFDEFVQNIMAWVQRKGIGAKKTKSGNKSTSKDSLDSMQQAAYAIALNIIQNGIKAHPYLYPAFDNNRKKFIDDLKAALK